jgi:PAS domain S-box-containing protein
MSKPKILIVEDEVIVAKEIEDTLLRIGYDVCSIVNSGEKAIQKAEEELPDIILMDVHLKGKMDGIEAAGRIRQHLDLPVVYLTAFVDQDTTERAKLTHPLGYLQKPFQESNLRVALEMARYTAGVEVERKGMMEALIKSEKRYRDLFNSMVDGFAVHEMIWDEDGKSKDYTFLKVNPAFERLTGLKARDIYEKSVLDVIPGTDKSLIETYGAVVQTRQPANFGYYSKDIGRHFEISAYAVGKNQFACSFVDVTDRKKAEKELARESEINSVLTEISRQLISPTTNLNAIADLTLEYSKSVTQSEHGYVSIIDQQNGNNILFSVTDAMSGKRVSESGEKVIFRRSKNGSYPKLCGHPLNTKKPFYTNHPSKHPVSKGVPSNHFTVKNFLSVPVIIEGRLSGQIAVANSENEYSKGDLKAIEQIGELYALAIQRAYHENEKEALEDQMRQMQKMEAIGTLAGGIAHDFNNILQPIMGYANMALKSMNESDSNFKYLSSVLVASRRARELVQQILTFARKSEKEHQPVQVQLIVKEALKLLRSSLPSTIEIRQQIGRSCGMVMADPTTIHQIVMNLTTNAYHAMLETGGLMEVSLKQVQLKMEDIAEENINPGNYVCLGVSDTGIGMSQELMIKIFDPYFTTKDRKKGTGLGLSVVRGIVKNCGGTIRVSSEPGKGSRFDVYLPELIEESVAIEPNKIKQPITGTESILLVDDESSIIELNREMLQELGYQVTDRSSSVEALEVFKSQVDRFDLVITDMTMPNMTGTDLAKQMLAIKPDLPIILCTGFSELINEENARAMGIKKLLMKPASQDQLGQSIREALDGS